MSLDIRTLSRGNIRRRMRLRSDLEKLQRFKYRRISTQMRIWNVFARVFNANVRRYIMRAYHGRTFLFIQHHVTRAECNWNAVLLRGKSKLFTCSRATTQRMTKEDCIDKCDSICNIAWSSCNTFIGLPSWVKWWEHVCIIFRPIQAICCACVLVFRWRPHATQ